MGVTYKLKDEVVRFIVSQRQGNPLFSCRQLAEAASQEFGLNLSKSSVHDVLKESGIVTPRGRKPKNKFAIPQEKKKQIQNSLSKVKLLPAPADSYPAQKDSVIKDSSEPKTAVQQSDEEASVLPQKQAVEISPEYDGAGRIFIKAVLWDLGIFSETPVAGEEKDGGALPEQGEISFPVLQETDWIYFLTYCKGIRVVLENNKDFFIDLPLPLERCIREVADGLINNVNPFMVHKVSDEALFKACMDAQTGFKIENISIVGQKDHIFLELDNIVELKRTFSFINRLFVESNEINFLERTKLIFISQTIDNNSFMNNILNLKGFDTKSKDKNIVTLLIDDTYDNKPMLQEATEKLNGMYLRDDQNRLVRVEIQSKDLV